METQEERLINYSDNFFTQKEQEIIYEYCIRAKYSYGEQDNDDGPVTGMVHDIPETEFIYKLFSKTLYDRVEFIRDMNLYRMYINCFSPYERSDFHTDGEGYTFLYYPDPEIYEVNEGGETQFIVDDNIMGVLPISNRMVVFDGTIIHRATPFRSRHRFTVAIKYGTQIFNGELQFINLNKKKYN